MLLEGNSAIVYGAAGAIGSTVARAFAREGATVFLAGRTLAALDAEAKEIAVAGGAAETARVDALDEQAVEMHADGVARHAGGIDVSFNAIDVQDVQGTPLLELPLEDFSHPIVTGTTTHYLTARAAARHMVERRSGVILTLSASAAFLASSAEPGRGLGGFGVACAAIEALTRSLAGESSGHTASVSSACGREGIPETWPHEFRAQFDSPGDWGYGGTTREEFEPRIGAGSLLQRLPTLAAVANVAVFMASDRASALTATVANVTCGTVVD